MFTRLRWFSYGVIVSVVAGTMIVKRARTMRERLDSEGIARVVASFGADVVEAIGRGLQRSATPVDGDPTAPSATGTD